ncbi:MAG: hypothetical protein JW954_05880 [Dehalococcoidaceae bacterium]|nr:hypothetical protein [Dehalococcoidaceae bacterium]
MKIQLTQDTLNIKLNPFEMWMSFHGALSIPLVNINCAEADKPAWNMAAIRSPGTHIPFLLKAGTYQSPSGREFWCATLKARHLVLLLNGWNYDRIILSPGNAAELADEINRALRYTITG